MGSQSHGWLSIELLLFSLWAGARRAGGVPYSSKNFIRCGRKGSRGRKEERGREGGREGALKMKLTRPPAAMLLSRANIFQEVARMPL